MTLPAEGGDACITAGLAEFSVAQVRTEVAALVATTWPKKFVAHKNIWPLVLSARCGGRRRQWQGTLGTLGTAVGDVRFPLASRSVALGIVELPVGVVASGCAVGTADPDGEAVRRPATRQSRHR